MIPTNLPHRCWLFTPGDQPQKMQKAAQIEVDCVIFDWEDAVAVSRKDAARHLVTTAVTNFDFKQSQRFIRVNAPQTPFFTDDLAAATTVDIDGLIVPKIETAARLQQVQESLGSATIPLYAIIETALGIMNLKEIAQAIPSLVGLMFGAEDLTADLGAAPSPGKPELIYARSAVVTAATAYGLQAIDTVFTNFHDQTGLESESQFAQQMGYSGKMAIHPAQIETIQRVFSPTSVQIAQAKEIVTAYEAHLATGEGVFEINGRMIDTPVIRAAQQTLNQVQNKN